MKVSVFGLGYVGCTSAACLAAEGHHVIGVDTQPLKVELFNAGRSPIVEHGMDELVAEAVAAGRLRATTDGAAAVRGSDLSLICVGTPSDANGNLDLQYVERVCADIGRAMAGQARYHVVVVRSTMLPGSTDLTVRPILEQTSGLRPGADFGLAYNPEFLREGSAVADFQGPPYTVIGEWDERSGAATATLYAGLASPLIRTDIRTAEMVKYANNAFHALKIAFANEIGALCQSERIDSHKLMDIFCQDHKLNISTAYLRPGYAFGGSCLPKDLRALAYRARERHVSVPVLEAILESNELHKRRGLALVQATGKKKVIVLGLSFKPGTDDLRESPAVELVEALIGKGYLVKVYDRNVALARLVGANKAYIEYGIPHIASLMVPDLDAGLAEAEVVVVLSDDPEFYPVPARLRPDQILVDLVRVVEHPDGLGDRYHGLAW